MNNSFFLQQLQTPSNLDAYLISRQYKLNLMAGFMRMKYGTPNLKHSQKANQLRYSTNTLQIYRNDINMVSPYRTQSNNTNRRANKASDTNFDNNSHLIVTLKDLV